MAKPTVTIGMCVYNAEPYIADAVHSALNQTYDAIRLLVYDDGSTDKSMDIVRAIDDPRMSILGTATNRGIGHARKSCARLVDGNYFCWLDADDMFAPDRIATLVDKARATGADIVADMLRHMDVDGKLLPTIVRVPDRVRSDPHCTRLFERNCMIPHPLMTVAALRSIQYDDQLGASDDYDAWIQLSLAGKRFAFVDRVGVYYRRVPGSASSDPATSRKETKIILSKYDDRMIAKLYLERGYGNEHVSRMLCLRATYLELWECAFGFAACDWPADGEEDRMLYLGTLACVLGYYKYAREVLSLHLNAHPRCPTGLNNYGVTLRHLNHAGSTVFFTEALQLKPDYVDAANNLRDDNACILTHTQIRD